MINSRRRNADGLAVTIKPQFDPRANPAMVCSIPLASRASTGVNSTPIDGATAWIAANCAVPEVIEGSPSKIQTIKVCPSGRATSVAGIPRRRA